MGVSPIAWSRRKRLRPYLAVAAAVALAAGAAAGATAASASTSVSRAFAGYKTPAPVSQTLYRGSTSTPIKHLVVLFDENESFDHYFGTYPYAANTDGTKFIAKPGTPTVNGLYTKITKSGPVGPLLTSNPNEYNPQRLTHSEALTSDQNHGYTPEQQAVDGGKMDHVRPEHRVRHAVPRAAASSSARPASSWTTTTATPSPALWNYAQNYSMSDNNWDTTFGPSTPGALNVISGDTGGATALTPTWSAHPEPAGHLERRQRRLDERRRRPVLRHVLGHQPHHHRRARRDERREHRRPAERQPRHVGLVPGRLRADLDQQRRRGLRCDHQQHRAASPTRTTRRTTTRSSTTRRPRTRTTWRRARWRRSATPTRPTTSTTCRYFTDALNGTGGATAALGVLPEGAGGPGRSPRLLRPARRAEVPGQHDQLGRAVQVLVVDRDRHHLRRLGRLVRPRRPEDRQRVQRRHPGRRDLHLGRGDASAPPTTAAATASGCRSW